MPVDLLLMMTWTTLERVPLIERDIALRLQQMMPMLAKKGGAELMELAIVPTHVHVIAELGTKNDISMLAQYMKGASARFINQMIGNGRPALRWAPGYDARSVGRKSLGAVRFYFDKQDTHHGVELLARWSKSPLRPVDESAGTAGRRVR